MTDSNNKIVDNFGLPYNYYVILRQRTQKGSNYFRRGVVVDSALSFHAKHTMHLVLGSIVYYDKGRVLSIDKGIRYIAVRPTNIIYVINKKNNNNADTPFNLYTVVKHQINKHDKKYHRSGICIATDAQQHIKPGETVYYDYGRIIMSKNGVQHIAIPGRDLVLSGVPKD